MHSSLNVGRLIRLRCLFTSLRHINRSENNLHISVEGNSNSVTKTISALGLTMKNKSYKILIALLIIILSAGYSPVQNTTARSSSYIVPTLTPTWTTGIIDNAGQNGFVVTDLDQDSKVDLATCSNGYAYVLNYEAGGTYNTTWYSANIYCHRIVAADRDSNGVSEIYIATDDRQVLLFDGATHNLIDSFSLPESAFPADMAVGDADDDSRLEIVISSSDATFIYDALTFNLKWQANGFGGTQVKVGNIDDDPVNEIVVQSVPGHVLNAKLKTQEWEYAGGFGLRMDTGDVDADGRNEIAYYDFMYEIFVLEGDSQTIRWHLPNSGDTEEIAVADTNKDGSSEVLIGYAPWGGVTGYQGTDGSHLWTIPDSEYAIFGIGVGDTNNDSLNEVVWGSSSGGTGDVINISSWVTQTIEWRSEDIDGPLLIAADDIDLDGQVEAVLASRSSNFAYDVGRIRVYDGLTHQVEWSARAGDTLAFIQQMGIGQLDADPALEIIIAGIFQYDAGFKSFDGLSHTEEWFSPNLAWGNSQAMTLTDLDNDAIDEIIIGLPTSNIQVFHGASDVVQWDSGPLNGSIIDLAAGDVDGDGVEDIAVLTDQMVYLFDSGTWTEKLRRAVTGGELITIAEADLESGGSLDVISYDGRTPRVLQAWAGPGFPVIWQTTPGNLYLKNLESVDIDLDGINELILMGSEGENGSLDSVLWIGSHVYPHFWEYKYGGLWDTVNSLALSDLDSDGQAEFLYGTDTVIQAGEITTSTVNNYFAMLPLLKKACLPFFYDDFSNPNSGWPNQDAGNVLFEYTNGEYRILVRPEFYAAAARPGLQFVNYSAGVDVRNQTGVYGSYGIVFGLSQDWSTFYTLELYPDGWYGIYRYNYNQVTTLSEAYSPYINQGTALNKLKVERNYDQINAYANDKLLASLSDNFFTGNRYVGLIAFSYDQTNLDVRYDNFVVDQLICDGSNSSSLSPENGQPLPGYNFLDIGSTTKTGHAQP